MENEACLFIRLFIFVNCFIRVVVGQKTKDFYAWTNTDVDVSLKRRGFFVHISASRGGFKSSTACIMLWRLYKRLK